MFPFSLRHLFDRVAGKFENDGLLTCPMKGPGRPTSKPPRKRSRRLELEALEERYVLSTLLVTSSADSVTQQGTLRYAVANAASGDTIDISPALTNTPIVLTQGEILISKDLAIEAPRNAPATITVASPPGNFLSASRIFEIASNVHVALNHLIITKARAFFNSLVGGAIYNGGTLAITDCTLSGNSTDGVSLGDSGSGGAVFNFHGTLTITNSNLEDNFSGSGGAIENDFGAVTIKNSSLSGNEVSAEFTAFGGAIFNYSGTLVIINSVVSRNFCTIGNGGGICNSSGQVTIINSALTGNYASLFGYGGGLYNSSGRVTITNCALMGNYVNFGNGGGVYNDSGTLRLTNSTLSGNFSGHLSFMASEGGGVYNSFGTVTITSCTISANWATQDGGGIYNSSGTVAITNSMLFNNSAGNDGGGIYNNGTLTIRNSTIVRNKAPSGADVYMAGGTLDEKNSVIGIIGP